MGLEDHGDFLAVDGSLAYAGIDGEEVWEIGCQTGDDGRELCGLLFARGALEGFEVFANYAAAGAGVEGQRGMGLAVETG